MRFISEISYDNQRANGSKFSDVQSGANSFVVSVCFGGRRIHVPFSFDDAEPWLPGFGCVPGGTSDDDDSTANSSNGRDFGLGLRDGAESKSQNDWSTFDGPTGKIGGQRMSAERNLSLRRGPHVR